MKIKLLRLSSSSRNYWQLKPWLGIGLLLAIAFSLEEFVSLIDVSGIDLALALGITLGIIVESKFDLETLFVGGFVGVMIVGFIMMLLLVPLSHAIFESSFVLVFSVILVIAATIVMQWSIKNFICCFWGKLTGIFTSAIAISVGIMLSNLLA